MNFMGQTSTADVGSVNPLNQSITVLSADLQDGGLIAVGAAEGIGEQDGEGDAQPVAAQKGPCMAVLGAAFQGKDSGHAERAIRAGCNEPLQNDHQHGQEDDAKGYHGKLIIIYHDGINQHTRSQWHQKGLCADQKRCESESVDGGF
jgi:hypothetical protein